MARHRKQDFTTQTEMTILRDPARGHHRGVPQVHHQYISKSYLGWRVATMKNQVTSNVIMFMKGSSSFIQAPIMFIADGISGQQTS